MTRLLINRVRPDEHDAMIARSMAAIEEGRRVLCLPCWPTDYLPPCWPDLHKPADASIVANLDASWAKVSGTIHDLSR